MLGLEDMPTACPHSNRTWFSALDGTAGQARRRPSTTNELLTLQQQTNSVPQPWQPKDFAVADTNLYAVILTRYLAAKIKLAVMGTDSIGKPVAITSAADKNDDRLAKAQFSLIEKISWRNQLRGIVSPIEKEAADRLAIGGLRDAAESVGRLHAVASFGRSLGEAIRNSLTMTRNSMQREVNLRNLG